MARRRGHGEDSIYQREDGRWCAVLDLGYVNGKRKRKWMYGQTKKEVAQKLRDTQRQHDQSVDLTTKSTTVADYLQQWLDTVVSQRNKNRTQDSYAETIRRHCIPAIRHHRLDKLRPEHVQVMISLVQTKGLHRTAQYARTILVCALNQAVKWRLVPYNAAVLTEPPRVEKHIIEPLTIEQARALLDAVRSDSLEALYLIALSLGLRRGEILGLRREDVDLERRELRITGALQRIRGKLVRTTPKTKTSFMICGTPAQHFLSHKGSIRA